MFAQALSSQAAIAPAVFNAKKQAKSVKQVKTVAAFGFGAKKAVKKVAKKGAEPERTGLVGFAINLLKPIDSGLQAVPGYRKYGDRDLAKGGKPWSFKGSSYNSAMTGKK